jgi:hypothetical protein
MLCGFTSSFADFERVTSFDLGGKNGFFDAVVEIRLLVRHYNKLIAKDIVIICN